MRQSSHKEELSLVSSLKLFEQKYYENLRRLTGVCNAHASVLQLLNFDDHDEKAFASDDYF